MSKVKCLLIALICISCQSKSQNYWSRYNNQPVKTELVNSTTKDFEPTNQFKTKITYYPNGLIKSEFSQDKFRETHRYFIYKSDTLHSILSKIKSNDMVNYELEEVLATYKNIFPLKTNDLKDYNPYTGKNKTSGNTKLFTYTKNNSLKQVITTEDQDEDRYFTDYKINYKKGNISSSHFKMYKTTYSTDTVVEFEETSKYKIIKQSKAGPKHYVRLTQSDTLYFNSDYNYYLKKELKDIEFEYLKVSDILDYHLDDLYNKAISEETYSIINNKIKKLNTTNETSLISSRALQSQNWFIKRFYKNYIDLLIKENNFPKFYNVFDDVIKQSRFFDADDLNQLRFTAFSVARKDEKNDLAKSYFEPIYKKTIQKEKLDFEDMYVIALMAQTKARLDKKDEAKEDLNIIKTFKQEQSSLVEDYKRDLDLLIAEIHYELGNLKLAKAIVNDNIKFYTPKEGEDEFGVNYEALMRNEKLLEKINNQ
ncbi:hypothetical protein [Psychroflexus sp. ALD_RP9]|uniref:hypothetical protein n=1 Tax=Psychroflexus sp. ALD_RP9 TaxID=2777186 RepID=UPI001A8D3BBE|nr:hypothetical protein [Psychroflexus sp. ALD_RP9]QSS96261.1 hypothetical protein IMZ30_07275 [Psychroflexus sp. ALD_RP9]